MTNEIETAEISNAALALLREIETVPRVVGYDHRISELDGKRLIRWESGWGYIANDADRAAIKAAGAA